mgnify:CR=1 FL=1
MDLIFEEISRQHDRSSFDCGTPPLNDYLKKFARQNNDDGISVTIVAAEASKPKTILGYYSVSSGQIEFESMPPASVKGIPKYPIPIMRIGRLATDVKARGHGIGKELLMDALHRAIEASKLLGVYAVVVDAKDETAKNFYKKYQFTELLDKPMVLFILMSTVKDALR